jgi:hypothetical protein
VKEKENAYRLKSVATRKKPAQEGLQIDRILSGRDLVRPYRCPMNREIEYFSDTL